MCIYELSDVLKTLQKFSVSIQVWINLYTLLVLYSYIFLNPIFNTYFMYKRVKFKYVWKKKKFQSLNDIK